MAIQITPSARRVLERRYLIRDDAGRVLESPDQMLQRVAEAVAAADALFDPQCDTGKTVERFLGILQPLWFLPNSPTLMNAGRPIGQLSACFVLPIADSVQSIFQSLKQAALIHKSGGGTGFSFSRIRPAGDGVAGIPGVARGPVPFVRLFDAATEVLAQGGIRRGANMGVLRADHPDIEEFISAKSDPDRLSNFNLSVAASRDFMEAIKGRTPFALVHPRTGKRVRSASAEKILEMIADAAWQTGDPGILFMDRINQANPTPRLGIIEATNPCGEQPLLPYESCVLGSVNLSRMLTGNALDYDRLKQTVHIAVHFLDNVIEVNQYPFFLTRKAARATRKIGLGVMGFADMLIRMGIAYDSDQAENAAQAVMSFIQAESKKASAALARKRGNFPAYRGSIFDNEQTPHMRNATTTTVAPAGSIGMIAGVIGGIEPIFSLSHIRRAMGEAFPEVYSLLFEQASAYGVNSRRLQEAIGGTGTIQHLNFVPDSVKRIFKAAHDISAGDHIRIQAAFQKHTDNAVSKTINLPREATARQVREAFLLADESGCKGITVYRYGCRQRQPLTIGGGQGENLPAKENYSPFHPYSPSSLTNRHPPREIF